MLAGGLLYTAGALSYHRRWPDPYPSVFGYHEVFHAYVCAAAACQYLAIARFIARIDVTSPFRSDPPAVTSRRALEIRPAARNAVIPPAHTRIRCL